MIVIVLSACPEGLRGDLTRWLFEISAGVFVGKASARIREHLWERIEATSGTGRAILIWSKRNEQGLGFRTKNHHWETEDLDGLTLMRRPVKDESEPIAEMKPGWSSAAKRRKSLRYRK